MTNNPIFSIITVSYNSELTIRKTLNSVFNQTFSDYEHIIIDGNSNDGTLDILRSYDSQKMLYISEPDKGIYDAMNKGVSLAKGDYVAILNSDDFFTSKNVLEYLFEAFKSNNANIVYSGINFINDHNQVISNWTPKIFEKGMYRYGFHTPHPGFFAARELYNQLGNFDVDMPIAADFDLMFRFMESNISVSTRMNNTSVMMRSDGESSTLGNILKGLKDINNSFSKNNTHVFMPMYILRRYLPKIKRKTLTSLSNKIMIRK